MTRFSSPIAGYLFALQVAFFGSCVMILYYRVTPYAGRWLWLAVAVAALIRGRWEERSVAAVIAIAVVATRLVVPEDLGAPRYGVLIVDAVETAVLVAIAVRSQLWWPSWCAACHIASLSSHALYMLLPGVMDGWTYASALLVWSWMGFLPLAFATLEVCLQRYAPRAVASTSGCGWG